LSSRVRYANVIPYGVNQSIDGSGIFGAGSTYGSMIVNSIFSMVAVNADITTFYYNGESGADGGGTKVLTPFFDIQEDDPRYVAWATATELGKNRVRRLLALGYL
jgi:hypothetical protein